MKAPAIFAATLIALFSLGCTDEVDEVDEARVEAMMKKKCVACHTSEKWENRAFTEEEWSAILDKMIKNGVMLNRNEKEVLMHGWEY